LMGAYQRAFPDARFVALQDPPQAALTQASRVLAVGSLPALFRTSRASFERQPARLLSALPDRVAHYRSVLAAGGSGPKVALSWRSMRSDGWGLKKSMPLAQFTPLLATACVQFVYVQYGDTVAERAAVEAATGVRLAHFDGVDYFNDLEEMLAILEACDLLITTSNATAHFAGALGKRAWLIYPADRAPFHYWAHGGTGRSLWYPSVEIVTAPDLTDWNALVPHVAERLRAVGL
jgi:ADP-heptose:LPS heptosyltransferase